MTNEESLLFGGKSNAQKPRFGSDDAPEKTARDTAAAMKAMDVEGLVAGGRPEPSGDAAPPRTLATLFDAPAAAAKPTQAAKSAKPASVATATAPATPSDAEPGRTPKKRGFFARLFGWLFGK